MSNIINKIMKIPEPVRQGMFFGLNSGVITTTGLISGIAQTFSNPLYIIISIVSLAISDGFSEAYGLYISKKAEKISDDSINPFYSFVSLLITKALIVLSFLIPFIFSRKLTYFKNLSWPFLWGAFLLFILDYHLSEIRDDNFFHYYIPHIVILFIVMGLSKWFSKMIMKLE